MKVSIVGAVVFFLVGLLVLLTAQMFSHVPFKPKLEVPVVITPDQTGPNNNHKSISII